MRRARHLADRLVAEADQRLVEEDRLDRPDPLELDLDPLLVREARSPASPASSIDASFVGVEVPLVEQLLRRLDDRGHDPRPADHAARGADRAVAGLPRDLAEVERELRRACERVAALVHRRRAGVRGLPAPDHAVALDAEGAEHRAERKVERLEHRPLLDVQLEVGGRRLELSARLERAVEVDAVRGQRVGQRDPVTVDELAELVLVGHRAGRGARAEERAPEARAFLVGPVHQPDRDGRLAVLGNPAQHLDGAHHVEAAVEPAAVGHRVDVPAEQHRTRRRAAQREPLVAGLVDLLLHGQAGELAAQPLPRALPRLGPGHPLRAVLVAGQLLQLAELGDRTSRIQRHADDFTAVVESAHGACRGRVRSARPAASGPCGRACGRAGGRDRARRAGSLGVLGGLSRDVAALRLHRGRSWSTRRRCRTSTTWSAHCSSRRA